MAGGVGDGVLSSVAGLGDRWKCDHHQVSGRRSSFGKPVPRPVCAHGTHSTVSGRHQKEARVRRKGGAWLSVMSEASRLPRLGCGGSPCSPMPHSPEECRRLRTCSECLARHPRTLQPGDGEVRGGVGAGGWVSGATKLLS